MKAMMLDTLISTLFAFSVLFPTKLWFSNDQPVVIQVRHESPVRLVLCDFQGRVIDTQQQTNIEPGKTANLREMFPAMTIGTYILYALPPDKQMPDFVGTPLVVQVRSDKRVGAPQGPLVTRVEPLRYAVMKTPAGEMTMAFYYDVAPSTVGNWQRLAEEGYFDGQVFHRIIAGFVLQAGDPLGTEPARAGTGGPGYMIDAEFNDRPHRRGVLSMARQGDPMERTGVMPRSEAANSASSQFFICLDYDRTKALDGKYTAFGRIIGGDKVIDTLAASPTTDGDRPDNPPVIEKVTIKTVTPGNNPYSRLFEAN
jgi:peptidyl-prolyl cis-trans isomerase B (cyclophilin B)